jgi:potassium-transporting ATPase KdpC subunit
MKTLLISLKIFLFFTILTGVVYPLFVTAIAQFAYHEKANGSLILRNNKIVGSKLVGQYCDTVIYFTSRPSSILYSPLPSGGSNYGLTNEKLKNLVKDRKKHFIVFNQLDSLTNIPSEMLFASASGLDPHISPAAAYLQVNRIVQARNFNTHQKQQLEQLIKIQTETPQFLILGEQRVNVLLLNLKLDEIK